MNLIDIFDPSSVRLNGIGGKPDQLDATLGEFGLELCEGTELGRAHGSVIFWVREENDPVVTDELVEIDGPFGGLSLEVRRG